MAFTDDELLAVVAQYLLPFFRIAAFIGTMPVIGTGLVSARIRLMLAIAVSAAVIPPMSPIPAVDPLSLQMVMLIAQQVIIGASMGFVLQIIFAAVVNGGQIVGMQMGLGFAQMMDPQTGVSVPVVSQFFNLLTILLFLALNGHLIAITIIVESFQVLPIGQGGLANEGLLGLAKFGAWIFSGGLLMALPAVAALLLINIIMGVITRATPQMNIFAVGFSITIAGGFMVLAVALASIGHQIESMLGGGLDFMRTLLAIR